MHICFWLGSEVKRGRWVSGGEKEGDGFAVVKKRGRDGSSVDTEREVRIFFWLGKMCDA